MEEYHSTSTSSATSQGKDGINGMMAVSSTKEFVTLLKNKFPELIDLVANFENNDMKNNNTSSGTSGGHASSLSSSSGQMRRQTRDVSAFYPNHETDSQVKQGLLSGLYLQGILRCSRSKWDDCYVVVSSSNDGKSERESVLIVGDQNVNRAMEGDVVAIERITQSQDMQGNNNDDVDGDNSANQEEVEGEESEMRANMSEPTAAPQPGDLEQVKSNKNSRNNMNSPIGRVVGIVRRNWKQYCG